MKERKIELNKPLKQSTKICDANISKIQVNQDDSISEQVRRHMNNDC